ncbi:NAD(P)/FAD-dependent oxidoreductase [Dendrosporobacter sp. 1207_IL3150]|uniref:NAD(P)/FAD-dependent oxidoreductase n=1 Tax=Dendrosporobacter sp. 1207_IL3150 TaxID=3084054 RepID=UPI002FDA3AA5
MDRVDSIIIGGGVIGLAIAYELSQRWPDKSILLLEKEATFGKGLSSRTSEVIHSGVYYPTDSLKAKLCVSGNRLLYEFCNKWKVPYNKIGKLIIAQDDKDIETLEFLFRQAVANEVPSTRLLNSDDITKIEPNIKAQAALCCPTSGIVDSHKLMASLAQGAKQNGAMLVYKQEVFGIRMQSSEYIIDFIDENGDKSSVACRALVNAAGLTADRIASMAGINVDEAGYRIYRCKGEYFAITNRKAAMVNNLIFPVSIRELKGPGIPLIKDLKGRLRLGPDAHYASSTSTDYSVQPGNAAYFYKTVSSYLTFLELADLQPDIAGLRPRLLVPCGSPPRDFIICHEIERNLPGFVNLIGIESPGITCCLSLARYVSEMLEAILLPKQECF